jgi:two-component system, OmpR family, response regulator
MSELHKILYVEDEPDIQAVAKVALEMVGGFSLQICSSGQEALEAAPKFAPDLVLLDVMMPGMDGITTMQNLRLMPDFSTTPMIFMTAKVQPGEVEEYLAMGVQGVIAKPFDPMQLAAEVRRIWEQAHA